MRSEQFGIKRYSPELDSADEDDPEIEMVENLNGEYVKYSDLLKGGEWFHVTTDTFKMKVESGWIYMYQFDGSHGVKLIFVPEEKKYTPNNL